jgi:hypothetical protein
VVVGQMVPSQQQRDASVDSHKWESALAFVASASALKRAIDEHGLMSEEARLAQHHADVALKEYKKWRLK